MTEIRIKSGVSLVGDKVIIPHLESALFGLAVGLSFAAEMTINWWFGLLAALVWVDLAVLIIGTRRQERAELLKMLPTAG